MTGGPLLRVTHLTKRFGPVTVLDDVGIEVRSGEVCGLAGQNGSGKSTLIKCLSGFHQPSGPWSLEAGGEHLARGLHPGEPARLGISFVHQDLGLLPDLTVLDNLLLFQIGTDRRPFVRWDRAAEDAERLFTTFGIDLDPRARLSDLRPVEQAQVAIVRAVSQLHRFGGGSGARGVLVLDEATTFLDRPGREVLHALLRSIVGAGLGVLFVSHDVEELLAVADRITVLRDGKVVESAPTSELTHDDVVGLIVAGQRTARLQPLGATPAGVDVSADRPTGGGAAAGELEVAGLSGDLVRRVDLRVATGEILGLTGIVGGGWETALELLYGARHADAGSVRLGDRVLDATRATPLRSIEAGMVYVPADRLAHGVIPGLTVQENVMLPVLGDLYRRGHLQLGALADRCRGLLDRHAVSPGQPELPINTLSGGNQQKAVLAKWLQLAPRVVLLNEPTQGVDVGARRLILEEIRALAKAGAIVLYASGNWEEVAMVSDRVAVVADGVVTSVLAGEEVTAEAIAREAYRGTRQSTGVTAAAEIWELVR